jgi:hypothetical protein
MAINGISTHRLSVDCKPVVDRMTTLVCLTYAYPLTAYGLPVYDLATAHPGTGKRGLPSQPLTKRRIHHAAQASSSAPINRKNRSVA